MACFGKEMLYVLLSNRRNWRYLTPRYLALAAIAPVIWFAVDGIITGNPLASRALVSEDRAIYASLIVHCSCCRGAKK